MEPTTDIPLPLREDEMTSVPSVEYVADANVDVHLAKGALDEKSNRSNSRFR